MARLLRPAISVDDKCRVVLRQLGEAFIEDVIAANRYRPRDHRRLSLGRLLAEKKVELASLLGCEVKDLRLDHDPALGAREQVFRAGDHVGYVPDANDPEYLRYRPHGAQFDGSHDVKTRIRGDHGQYSDIVLIKRKRRRDRKEAGRLPRRSKPIRSASRWPQKGSRKINWRPRP